MTHVERKETIMSEPTPVNVTVNFASGTTPAFTYSAPSPPAGVVLSGAKATLSANQTSSHYAFIFQLAGSGLGQTLHWDTPSIIWTAVPPTLESGFTLPTASGTQVVVGVHYDNTSGSPKTFGFRLKVIYDGQHVESPDPEIILDPP
jgi:hypothetical protein